MALSLATLILAGTLHFVAYVIYKAIRTMYFSKLLEIPGLAYGPLYGNVRESMVGEATESSLKWVKKYGGIVRFYRLFGREALLLADVDAIRHVLVTNSMNYPRRSANVTSEMVPEGLVSIEGPTHRATRKLLNPSFNNSAIKGFMPLFHQIAVKMNKKLDKLMLAEHSRVNVQHLVKSATMAVIGVAAFDQDFGALDVIERDNEIVESFSYVMSQQSRSLLSSLPFYQYLPLQANIKYKKALKVVNDLSTDMIQRSRDTQGASQEPNLLKKLIMASYKNVDGKESPLSNSTIRDHIITFMIAGHETSAYSLTWLLLELARNPDIQEKLYGELLPFDCNSIALDTLDNLKYLDACIKEVLRLHSPVPSTTRTASHDDVICGYTIPAGTEVNLHFGALMRTCIEDGEVFKPERFLQDQFVGKHWLPFSIGSHACIGNKFALVEMKVLTVYLVQTYTFSPVPGLLIRKRRALVVKPSPDVELMVSRRTL